MRHACVLDETVHLERLQPYSVLADFKLCAHALRVSRDFIWDNLFRGFVL